jgi:uncharacterized membrane protein YfcA
VDSATFGRTARAIVVGLIAGFLAGMFGVGGGVVAVPLLVLWLGLAQHRAHATSMAAILATASAAVVVASAGGAVDWRVAGILAIGSVFGAYAGTRLLDRVSELWLAVAFSLLAVVSAVRLFFAEPSAAVGAVAVLTPVTIVALVLIGLVAGTLAALLGVGGGIIYVPAMVLLLGLPQHVAQGTSLATIIPTALVATLANARVGRVDWRSAIGVGLGGVVAGVGGVLLAFQLEGVVLQRLFAVLLVLVTLNMLRKVWRSATKPPGDEEGAPDDGVAQSLPPP